MKNKIKNRIWNTYGDHVAVLTTDNKGKGLVGISVREYTSIFDPSVGIMLDVMNAMGFSTKEEYINIYPGNFRMNSAMQQVEDIVDGVRVPHRINTDITMSETLWNKHNNMLSDINKEIISHIENDDGDRYGIMLMTMPTMEEMRTVYGVESLEADDLWFCSDWENR